MDSKPIFILGNQKSGTTAIAWLLSLATGLSLTQDLKSQIKEPTYQFVKMGKISFTDFLKSNENEFLNPIIKEPNLSLFTNELFNYFKFAQYVFVIRDPRDNIRSILDRLDIAGDLKKLRRKKGISRAWRIIINNEGLNLGGNTYIEKLAHRWNYMADVYNVNRERFILVKYEDFMKNKKQFISFLSEKLGVKVIYDISSHVDEQFQPQGKNRGKNWSEFFSEVNLENLVNICNKNMLKFGYLF